MVMCITTTCDYCLLLTAYCVVLSTTYCYLLLCVCYLLLLLAATYDLLTASHTYLMTDVRVYYESLLLLLACTTPVACIAPLLTIYVLSR